MRLLAFLKHIIKYFVNNEALSDALYYACPNTYKANTIEDFTAQLKEDSKTVVKKVQIHFLIYNSNYFKYNISQFKVYRFDFPEPKILAFYIDHNRSIQLK